ncbi:MAG: hypothetical protein II944_08875 [Ruminobacter sp.]|nr:hypothetical protein [Ruminobacter sp.]
MTGYFLYFNFSEKRSMITGVMIPEKTGERHGMLVCRDDEEKVEAVTGSRRFHMPY